MYAIVYSDNNEYSAYCTTTNRWVCNDSEESGNWFSLAKLISLLKPENFTVRDEPGDDSIMLENYSCPYKYAKAVTADSGCVNMEVILTAESLDNFKEDNPELFL